MNRSRSFMIIIVLLVGLQAPVAAMDYLRKGATAAQEQFNRAKGALTAVTGTLSAEMSNRLATAYQNAQQLRSSVSNLQSLTDCLDKGTCSQKTLAAFNTGFAQVGTQLAAMAGALQLQAGKLSQQMGPVLGTAQDKLAQALAAAAEKFGSVRAFGNRLATGQLNPAEKAQLISALKVVGIAAFVVAATVGTILVAKGAMNKAPKLPWREPVPGEAGYEEWQKIRPLPAVPSQQDIMDEPLPEAIENLEKIEQASDRGALLEQIQAGVKLKKGEQIKKKPSELQESLLKRRQAIAPKEDEEEESVVEAYNKATIAALKRDIEDLKSKNMKLGVIVTTPCSINDRKCENSQKNFQQQIKSNATKIKELEEQLAAAMAA